MNVSVVIPTYRRPEMLAQTLESVFKQTVPPFEILIGDDSPDDETEKMVERIARDNSAARIRYFHHRPALKELRNVDHLYAQAQGDLILHMHDDDPLFECCVEVLRAPLMAESDAVASFGLQRLIGEDDAYLHEPEIVNKEYFRTPDRAGLVDGLQAAAIQMFPNNGFMIRADAARAVGYNDQGRSGYATDFYFGLRLGKLGRPFYFVDRYTSKVRLTTSSQSRGNPAADNGYRVLRILYEDIPSFRDVPLLEDAVRRNMPVAIAQAAKLGDTARGWSWYFSEYHRGRIATVQGAKGALKLSWASVRKALGSRARPGFSAEMSAPASPRARDA